MKQLIVLAGLIAVVFLLWDYPLLYPLKLLVVFFHESSHALMALATGGSVESLVIDEMQGGQVISRGGNRFLTLSAGYLGSLLLGLVIYLLAVRTRLDKALMTALGLCVIIIAGLFVRDLFALGFAGLIGGVFIVMGWKLSMQVNDMVLRLIGLTNMLYVPYDIYSDTIARAELLSDALMLAQEFGGAGWLWGTVWLAISIVLIAVTLIIGLAAPEPEDSDESIELQ